MNLNYRFFAVIAFLAAFLAAYAAADEISDAESAAKKQPPLTVLWAHVDVSPLGYTFFEMEFRANQKIVGWECNFEGHPKIGTCTQFDLPWEKGQTQHWFYTWDTARPIKSMKCSIISIQVPTGTGNPKQVMLETPITFEAKPADKRAFKGQLDMARLKDPKVRTTAEVIAFFERDGTYNAKANRIYTLKELRSALGEPKNINQGIAERMPMPDSIPPGFDAPKVIARIDAMNADLPRRSFSLNYECRDGIATADLNQLGYHGDNAIDETIRLQIHTAQVFPVEKQSEK